jgi:hypothetical protein
LSFDVYFSNVHCRPIASKNCLHVSLIQILQEQTSCPVKKDRKRLTLDEDFLDTNTSGAKIDYYHLKHYYHLLIGKVRVSLLFHYVSNIQKKRFFCKNPGIAFVDMEKY